MPTHLVFKKILGKVLEVVINLNNINYCIYRAIDQLSKLDGSKIFAMSRTDLIAAFGKQEGIRLDSQITISRNSAGYQTAKTSELRNILERARQRSEKSRRSPDDGHAFSMA